MNNKTPSEGDLRVWWIPQIQMMTPFYVRVSSPLEAKKLIDALGQYDAFQFEHKVKPDYCNTGGLEVFADGEWVDWESEDGDDIDSYGEE